MSAARPPAPDRDAAAGPRSDPATGPGSALPPPGPFRPAFWRSPLRGPWFTSLLGTVLLVGLPVMLLTGLLSYAAYNPGLHGNDRTPGKGLLGFYLFAWPTDPHWLYRLNQGVHVTLGVALVPVLLAKLWSVVPRLFAWPPLRSARHALERGSILLLVASGLFEFVTGIINMQLFYVFPGSFYTLHFYGAWVFLAALVVHLATRIPKLRRGLRDQGMHELRAPDPAPPTISRRGAVALVGAGSLGLVAVTAGQSIGGPLRRTALLAPHGGGDPGEGPNGFQINKTAAALGIEPADIGERWRLVVRAGNGRRAVFTRAELLELPQHTASLPIACVEGWSTDDQLWRGVRLADLAALVGAEEEGVFAESVQEKGTFKAASLRDNQVRDPRSLLALHVNGAPLSRDHGYPARIIVPANPGVHNTKWVTRLTFGELP
ncbi:molybdopterin-dependent oxidoreductase [Streptomyces sp. WMMC500]|uniref:molybdopterin-dependent oxidoreductase n=1 Tax=Streptomyces sp. WMMC500 TaxID=3015154 RepID=UPI00248C2606|nr:molybdopterin-dependent oxidoreductase [Streptomyces sp. WMMC500]WBB58363.1 molybdopterin-dependent oxidoreductase [Streptomyces sp. WMMC500]